MDKLDFLEGADAPVEDVQPVAETVAETPPEPQPEARERDESGRFKGKAPVEPPVAAQPEPQPEPAQQPEPRAEPIMVPLAALHETRDKLKDMEGRLARYEQASRPQPQPVEVPDPVIDPEGFAQFQNQQFDNQRYGDRLYFSEQLAVMKHGDETFQKAREWGLAKCDADPMFNAKVRQSQDPYSIVMAEYQRDQITSQVSMTDFEQFQAWKAAQGQLAQNAQQQAAPAATPETPALPRSIATAPSAGGVQTIAVGPGVAFDDTIK